MRTSGRALAWIAGAVLLLGAAAATATPVTYGFTSGTATVTASVGASDIGSGLVPLTGVFVTFDEAVPELVDFLFTGGPSIPISITSYAGYDTITVDTVSIAPDAGYTNYFTTGPNPYSVLVGPLIATGTFSATGVGPPISGAPFVPPITSDFLSGTIDIQPILGGSTLTLSGITLGEIGPFGDETEPVVLKADLSFTGAFVVPEPGTLSLALGGIAGLAGLARRQRRAA